MIRQFAAISSFFSTIILSACAPVFNMRIPPPRGAYEVGRTSFVLVDSSRNEPFAPTTEHRIVTVKAWYPADPSAGNTRAEYLPHASTLPGQFQFGERFVASHLQSHAKLDAAVSARLPRYPVLMFSPGNDIAPDFYSGLLVELASHGYVVLALDHSYEGKGQILPDGRRLPVTIGKFRPPPSARAVFDFYRERSDLRAADGIFLLNQLSQSSSTVPLRDRLNLQQVGAFGHSIGGVSAGQMCRHDSRFKACANIDGLVRSYPLLPENEIYLLQQPFLYVGKPLSKSPTSADDSTRRAFQTVIASGGGGYDVVLNGANHDSFTDYPFFKPTLRPVRHRANLSIVRDALLAFFNKTLTGNAAPFLDNATQTNRSRVLVTKLGVMNR